MVWVGEGDESTVNFGEGAAVTNEEATWGFDFGEETAVRRKRSIKKLIIKNKVFFLMKSEYFTGLIIIEKKK